ncbi:chlorohydrolase family protein [Roseovarius aestuarii]|nr:chlorohydrolase family protein [Roseovarius aestuarii]
MRTLLTAAWVVGYEAGGHVLLRNGEVAFEGDTVLFVGHGFDGPVDRRVDYGQAMIGPGFVDLDALGDVDTEVLTFDRGPAETLGRVWTEDALRRGPSETFTPGEELAKYRYGFTRLLRNGITSAVPITSMLYRQWAESYDEMAGVAHLAADMGLRVWLGPCYMSGLTYQNAAGQLARHWDEARGLQGLEDAERFITDFDGTAGGRISAALLPDRIETQMPSVLKRTADIQRASGIVLRIHCCQSTYEMETVLALRGTTSLGWLEQMSLLTERTILPHGIYLSDHPQIRVTGQDDRLRLISTGVTIAHCPVIFGRDGEFLDSFAKYLRSGIRMGMGTDTHPCDMIQNIRVGRMLNAVADGGPTASAADFYTAATIGGADALGRPDLGRLAPGTKADIAVFDLAGLHLGPVDDPIHALALAGSGRDCRSVWVAGRQLVQDFAVVGVDETALGAEARRLYAKARMSHADRAPERPDPDLIFHASYPVYSPKLGCGPGRSRGIDHG